MTRRWLFADQLGPHFAPGRDGVLLVESRAALGRRRYHRQKLHLVLSALTRAGRTELIGRITSNRWVAA